MDKIQIKILTFAGVRDIIKKKEHNMLYNSKNLGHQVLLATLIDDMMLDSGLYRLDRGYKKSLRKSRYTFSTALFVQIPFDIKTNVVPENDPHTICVTLYVDVTVGKNQVYQYVVTRKDIAYEDIDIMCIRNSICDAVSEVEKTYGLVRRCECSECKVDFYSITDSSLCRHHL